MQPQANRNKLIALVGGILLVAFIAAAVLLGNRPPSSDEARAIATDVTIRVVPTNSSLKINGHGVKAGANELDPGTYTITASLEGFASESRTVTLKEGDHLVVGLVLNSNDSSTADYYKKNPDQAREAEGITGQNSEAAANSKVNALPLLKDLPRLAPHRYEITYGQSLEKPNDPAASTIYIDYVNESAKTAAENWIRYQGYNPTDLEINYTQKSDVQ